MRRAIPLFLVLLGAGAGCRATGFYLDNPANPIPGVRKFAVAPVESPETADPLKLGEILAGELVQFPGTEVIRPADVVAAARKNGLVLTDERSLRALGRILKADAVLVAAITESKTYYPPRLAVAAQLFFVGGGPSGTRSAIDLSLEGRAGGARPVTLLDRGELIQIEKVYDGSHRETRDLAAYYARGHYTNKEAIDGADRVLRLPDFYFRFVSNRLVRDIFADWQARQVLAKENTRK